MNTREQITALAIGQGWTVAPYADLDYLTLSKGDRRLWIWFTANGSLAEVTCRVGRDKLWTMGPRDRDKFRSIVLELEAQRG